MANAVADGIREKGGEAVLHTCEDFDGSKVAEYDAIAFGCPAMGDEELEDTVFQLLGGLRAGMGYCGAKDIPTLQNTARFVKISAASLKESHPHDIHITKEAPNYSIDE